jgi:hypothetical protein
MSYPQLETVTVTTVADGSATAYSGIVNGRLSAIRYVKTDYANGVDFAITSERTGATLWAEDNVNASKTCYPRAGTHDTAGVAALYAAAGTAVNDAIVLVNDRVKIVIAQGGDTKSGTFYITVD